MLGATSHTRNVYTYYIIIQYVSIGTANFVHYLEFWYKSIEEYANGTLEKFHYERFFTMGGFIIGGSTVAA